MAGSNNVNLSTDNSTLTLSPVNSPGTSSGGYTCSVTVLPADSTYINEASANNTVSVTVLGETVNGIHTLINLMCSRALSSCVSDVC